VEETWAVGDEFTSVDGFNDHRLLRCRGCETVFYLVESTNSEDWDGRFNPVTGQEEMYHPVTRRTYPAPESALLKPEWVAILREVDLQLFSIVDQVYEAREHRLLILAAVGLRTAFDRSTELLGIDPAKPLVAKVEDLVDRGAVGMQEAALLKVIVDAGSAAAHRGWSPTPEEFQVLLDWLEQFLVRSFVKPRSPDSVKSIPAKPKRL
jgi:hypothetical protein